MKGNRQEVDPISKVLYIDLTRKDFWVETREDLFKEGIGGTSVGIRLLEEECPSNCDPLSPENPIILAVGPLTGLFPLASKTVALFKSPHTGNLGESHAGGRSAVSIRMAGYGAIVIKGASETPVYLAIHGNRVNFRDASSIWGIESMLTVGRILREAEPGSGLRTILRIGVAGERLIPFSTVVTETFRHFGRLGLGAVFGSKKLKAILISGKRTLPIPEEKNYRRLYEVLWKKIVSSDAMKKYHDLGTAENVLPLNELGALPTMNLLKTQFEGAYHISGENFAQNFLGRRLACSHCPVACIHIAALREPYERTPYFYKTSMISYDYEPIYALGSMLGIGDPKEFLRLLEAVERWGLDAISTGVTLSWATEAQMRGIITEKETMGIKLEWGNTESYISALRRLLTKSNEFYENLSMGIERISSLYGGKDFALAFGGNEMPGYHTGPCVVLGYLIGARHSHLDGAGYSLDQKWPREKPFDPKEIVDELIREETLRQILSSLVICLFARGIYSLDLIIEILNFLGYHFDEKSLLRLGEETLRRKNAFKAREGFSFEGLRIPERVLSTPTIHGKLEETFIREGLLCAKSRLLKKPH